MKVLAVLKLNPDIWTLRLCIVSPLIQVVLDQMEREREWGGREEREEEVEGSVKPNNWNNKLQNINTGNNSYVRLHIKGFHFCCTNTTKSTQAQKSPHLCTTHILICFLTVCCIR